MSCTYTTYAPDLNSSGYYTPVTMSVCPVPKIKKLYYPTQDAVYRQFKSKSCTITKQAAGATFNSINNATRIGNILSAGPGSVGGNVQFIANGGSDGMRAGQPGGIRPPLRNQF